jgi:tryptophan synthase alpha chain
LSPTSSEKRIKKIVAVAKGYIYYVSLKGVTGAGHLELDAVQSKVAQIKQHTSLPIAIGFGVKNPDIAANIAKIGDAVVVGSALINCITDNEGDEQQGRQAISSMLSDMRKSMDAVTL